MELDAAIGDILKNIPCSRFIMTAASDGLRAGILTRWVQICSFHPPQIMVSLPTGTAIEPLVRNSRAFAICQLASDERSLIRRFDPCQNRNDDIFLTLPCRQAPSGAPVLENAISCLDCELIRHVDLDADHRLFVGRIHHGKLMDDLRSPALEVAGECSSEMAMTMNWSVATSMQNN